MAGVGWVLAAATTPADPYLPFLNYGVLGLIALALFQGKLVPAKLYEQALADRDREHGELVALRLKTEEQFIPAIIRNTEIMTRVIGKVD